MPASGPYKGSGAGNAGAGAIKQRIQKAESALPNHDAAVWPLETII